MSTELIHDRGRGPELIGTRITVYSLLPHFLEPSDTEAYICRLYGLAPEQVAAARAYVLNNPETVLAEHLKIEARIAIGNPPEVVEQAKRAHETFMRFKKWLDERKAAEQEEIARSAHGASQTRSSGIPTMRQWLAEQDSPPAEHS